MNRTLELRQVALRVGDLPAMTDFYTRQLGFVAVPGGSADTVGVAAAPGAPPILTLAHAPGAVPAPRDAAGLFHAALRFATRARLGTWLRETVRRGVELDGLSDHAVSEAVYLTDPEGNGLEFYADRARETWPLAAGQVEMVTRPLDVRSLLGAADPTPPHLLEDAAWGHLHLRVTDLDRSEAFYLRELGLQVMQRSYPGARFLAADGYHHHLGLNVWGAPRQPQPAGALGLAGATFARAGTAARRDLRDPDGIAIRVEPL